MKTIKNSLLIFFILVIGCNNTQPRMSIVDFNSWKLDSNGCAGVRDSISDLILQNKSYFKGKNSEEVLQYFGKPNISVPKLNAFMYYISAGYHCQFPDSLSDAKTLWIYFNDRNYVKDIDIFPR